MTASPPAAPGLPSEEEIAAAMLVAFTENGLPAHFQEVLCYGDPGYVPPKLAHAAARAILSLIRPAFEAKDAEIERIKDEVELTMMSLIFVPAIRAAIEALPEEDGLQPYRARAEAALSAEAKLAQAVEELSGLRQAILDAAVICDDDEKAGDRLDKLARAIRARSASRGEKT